MSSRFIAKMEDVLAVYQRPYDPRYPVICMDEKGKELRATPPNRPDLPAEPNKAGAESRRQDYEYRREGSLNLLVACEPLRGWRKIWISPYRDGRTFARHLQQLVDEEYPEAERIVLVTDNLNIHGIWSLYDEFPPEEARRIAQKLEWHYTPEHGSWLNKDEIELSALDRQCLDRRMESEEMLRRECEAWEKQRNQQAVKIHWQFKAEDARIRLRRLYPVIEDRT